MNQKKITTTSFFPNMFQILDSIHLGCIKVSVLAVKIFGNVSFYFKQLILFCKMKQNKTKQNEVTYDKTKGIMHIYFVIR